MKFKVFKDKLLGWLKYFAFNFFHNGYAREGAKRSSLNFLFGAIAAFVLICGGLTIGYNTSFDKHYENSYKFREFLYSSLTDAGLTAAGGKLFSDKIAETLSGDGESVINGYRLVIDTRPANRTFDDFSIVGRAEDGREISYEVYLGLSSSDQGKYSLNLKYGGKTLDTAEKQDVYRAYLDTVSDENGNKYNGDIAAQYAALKNSALPEDELNDEIYKLYAKAYYPSFEKVEKYSTVPTVRSYYLATLSEKHYGKYLLLFDDYCIASFYTDDGIAVGFSGEYDIADGAVTDADGLIKGAFESNASMNFAVFASDMFISLIIFVILMLVVALVTARLTKKTVDYGNGMTGIFNILGGFLPVSGLIAFLFGIALPYALTVNGAYLAVRLIFLSVVLIRFAVLLVMDIVKSKKVKSLPEATAPVAAEPADPFEEETEPSADEPAEIAAQTATDEPSEDAEDKTE